MKTGAEEGGKVGNEAEEKVEVIIIYQNMRLVKTTTAKEVTGVANKEEQEIFRPYQYTRIYKKKKVKTMPSTTRDNLHG